MKNEGCTVCKKVEEVVSSFSEVRYSGSGNVESDFLTAIVETVTHFDNVTKILKLGFFVHVFNSLGPFSTLTD